MLNRIVFNPISLILSYFLIRFISKGFYALYDPASLRWSVPFEVIATTLNYSLLFLAILSITYTLSNKLSLGLKINSTPRVGKIQNTLLAPGVVISLAILYICFSKIISKFGGITLLLNNQASVASHVLEYNLGAYYGIMCLCIVPLHIYFCYKVETQKKISLLLKIKFLLILFAYSLPFIILSRRSVILLAVLPIIYYWNYNIRNIHSGKILMFSFALIAYFLFLVIYRIETYSGEINFQQLITSPEFALFDILAVTIHQLDYLQSHITLTLALDNPEFLTDIYLGAIIGKLLFNYGFTGGSAPPTIIGNAIIFWGWTGLLLYPIIIGLILSISSNLLRNSRAASLFFFYSLTLTITLLSNGDIYLTLKTLARYLLALAIIMPLFFKISIKN